jgi:hypothetical protein
VHQQKQLISAPECKLVFKLDVFHNIETLLLSWQRANVPETSAPPPVTPLNAFGLPPPPPPANRPTPPSTAPPPPPGTPTQTLRAPPHTRTPSMSSMAASTASTTTRTPATSVHTPTPVNASSPQLIKSLKRKPEATLSANKRPRRPTASSRDTRITPQQIQLRQQQQLMAQRTTARTRLPDVAQIRQQVNISQHQQREGTPMHVLAAAANLGTAHQPLISQHLTRSEIVIPQPGAAGDGGRLFPKPAPYKLYPPTGYLTLPHFATANTPQAHANRPPTGYLTLPHFEPTANTPQAHTHRFIEPMSQ